MSLFHLVAVTTFWSMLFLAREVSCINSSRTQDLGAKFILLEIKIYDGTLILDTQLYICLQKSELRLLDMNVVLCG